MKIVGLLRHAKSSRDDRGLRDFDRPLNPRGIRAAERMGAELRRREVRFDLILASPAQRVVETIENFEKGYGPIAPQFEAAIYESSAATLLNILRGIDDAAERVLVVGHNPSLQNLGLMLGASDDVSYPEIERDFPTAAAVLIELSIRNWFDVKPGTGQIAWFIKPRDLDPPE